METIKTPLLFNGAVEMGLRSLLLLLETHPASLDVHRLVILDYLVVHSGDVPGGPPSLHPPSPLRAGEVAFRRALVQQGLHLMMSRGLVSRHIDENGIRYAATDAASILIDALSANYVSDLQSRAHWAVARAAGISETAANTLLGETIERWRSEFVALPLEDKE